MRNIIFLAALFVVVLIVLFGCAHAPVPGAAASQMGSMYDLPHRPRAQSWDQENLHELSRPQGDCHVAAPYDAPNGELRFCL